MKLASTLTLLTSVFLSVASIAQPPANYYNSAAGKTCADLKTTLRSIISTGTTRSYNALWDQYEITDIKPREVGSGSANVIWDVYSDIPGPSNDPYNFTPGTGSGGQQDQGSGGTSEGQFYNREHTVPLSWFSSSTAPSSDYLHIFPTDKNLNNRRGSMPYGEVGTATFTSLNGSKIGPSSIAGITGTVFEPIDSFKGDLARTFLYFVTRYENNMASWAGNADATEAFEPNTFPSVDIPYLRMMINWHHLDPVSQKELTRNNGAYSFQQNRNPYIDHPEYVDMVWNSSCPGLSTLPVTIALFQGQLIDGKVRLNWTVENELNVNKYEVERSVNGISYQTIGGVRANNSTNYSFIDNAENNRGRRLYYRLKKVDVDGRFSYSEVLSIHIPLNLAFTVYPNPATTYIQLQLNSSISGDIKIEIADLAGKVVKQHTQRISENNVKLSTTDMAAGTYYVRLIINGEQYLQKVLVIK